MSSVNVESKSVSATSATRAPIDSQATCRTDDIVIGLGVRTSGNFQTAGSIFVDGVLGDANVECSSLSISRGGEFHGVARAARVEISGTLDGEAVGTEEIVLRASAVVSGKVSAPYIVVHRGACITGEVNSLQRNAEPGRAVVIHPPLSKYRAKRGMHLFMFSVAIGLALSGGAALAWLRSEQNVEVTSSSAVQSMSAETDRT
ncbi:polymer-forming cytoskeletal protein [Povalibacter sp.]|uniref:bactofilin family protein n=1 Tax=Povalibacter sp. TaxID=1962978 RepID=UPI002F42ABAB